jgi:hypothetical protein
MCRGIPPCIYVLFKTEGFTLLPSWSVCDSEWGLTTVSVCSPLALEAVNLEFYVWSEPLLRLEQFTGWRPIALVKEKRKKEKVTLMF